MALVRQGEYRVCGKRVYSMNLYVNLPNDHSHNSLLLSSMCVTVPGNVEDMISILLISTVVFVEYLHSKYIFH